MKVKSSFTYHCHGVLAPQYDRGLTGSVLSTATQWGPGRTGQIEVVKKELCSHVTGSRFALRPGIPVDPLRSHMNTMTKPAAEPDSDLHTPYLTAEYMPDWPDRIKRNVSDTPNWSLNCFHYFCTFQHTLIDAVFTFVAPIHIFANQHG